MEEAGERGEEKVWPIRHAPLDEALIVGRGYLGGVIASY
jgi:hypothetical protein